MDNPVEIFDVSLKKNFLIGTLLINMFNQN